MRHRRRVVFPNRDGVLLVSEVRNWKSFAARRASDLLIYPGVATALVRLKEAGHGLVFVTNKPDVAVGHAAGCRTIFMNRGWRDDFGLGADFVTESLGTAVNVILSR